MTVQTLLVVIIAQIRFISDKIYVHSGVSSTITDSFSSPSTYPSGLTYDGTNLISCDINSDKIYVYSGVSSTITNSFSSPGSSPRDGTNLISCDAGTDKIYVHGAETEIQSLSVGSNSVDIDTATTIDNIFLIKKTTGTVSHLILTASE